VLTAFVRLDASDLLAAIVDDVEVLAADRRLAVIPEDAVELQGHGDPIICRLVGTRQFGGCCMKEAPGGRR
jgi:hypothetical protein